MKTRKKKDISQLSLFNIEPIDQSYDHWLGPLAGIDELRKLQEKIFNKGPLPDGVLLLCTYDIGNTRQRNRWIKILKKKGMYRVQKSVFMGEIPRKRFLELQAHSRNLHTDLEETDHIMLIPLSEQNVLNIHVTGRALDLTLILNRRRVLFGHELLKKEK